METFIFFVFYVQNSCFGIEVIEMNFSVISKVLKIAGTLGLVYKLILKKQGFGSLLNSVLGLIFGLVGCDEAFMGGGDKPIKSSDPSELSPLELSIQPIAQPEVTTPPTTDQGECSPAPEPEKVTRWRPQTPPPEVPGTPPPTEDGGEALGSSCRSAAEDSSSNEANPFKKAKKKARRTIKLNFLDSEKICYR